MRQETQTLLNEVTNGLIRVAGMVRDDTALALSDKDHVVAIRHFADVRNAIDTIKTARKAIEEIEERLSKEQIPDIMRSIGVKSTKIEGIGTVGISYRFSCSILDDPQLGKEKGYDWLRSNGHESLITETVNSSTLSAFAKDMLENHGIELPPELFKVGTSPFTSIRK